MSNEIDHGLVLARQMDNLLGRDEADGATALVRELLKDCTESNLSQYQKFPTNQKNSS